MFVTVENLYFLRRAKKCDEIGIILGKSMETNVCLRGNVRVTSKYSFKELNKSYRDLPTKCYLMYFSSSKHLYN